MGTWNHRVIRYPDGDDWVFIIHEVHYDERGLATSWTERGVAPMADSLVGLGLTLLRMSRCMRQPILQIAKTEGRDVLIDAATGKPACNVPLDDLPPDALNELKAAATAIEEAVANDEPEKKSKH